MIEYRFVILKSDLSTNRTEKFTLSSDKLFVLCKIILSAFFVE